VCYASQWEATRSLNRKTSPKLPRLFNKAVEELKNAAILVDPILIPNLKQLLDTRAEEPRSVQGVLRVGGGEKEGHYGGLRRATGVVTRWTWQGAQKRNATVARVGHTTWLPYCNLSCPAATAGCVGSALRTVVGNAIIRSPLPKCSVTILRQNRRLSVAGPSKGPDRNRSKTERLDGALAPLPCNAPGTWGKQTPGFVKLLLPPRQSWGNS
jgi:hypothetical protein